MQCKTMRRNVIINCAAAQSRLPVAFLFYINRMKIKIFTFNILQRPRRVHCYTESPTCKDDDQKLPNATRGFRRGVMQTRERNYFYMHKSRMFPAHPDPRSSTSHNIGCGWVSIIFVLLLRRRFCSRGSFAVKVVG